MSGTMFGGSAFALDIGAKNDSGGSVSVGEILMLDCRAATDDGFLAKYPEMGGTDIGPHAIQGVVLGPAGMTFGNGSELLIRVLGVADVMVGTGLTVTAGQLGRCADEGAGSGSGRLLGSLAAENTSGYSERRVTSKFIILETVADTHSTGGLTAKCLVKGI